MRPIFILLLILLSTPSLAIDHKKEDNCLVTKIIDADTFKCKFENDDKSVRLIGIDAPESRNNSKTKKDSLNKGITIETILKMGELSKDFVRSKLQLGELVGLEFDVQRNDRYGRTLAYVYLSDGAMLNQLLLFEGFAQVMTIAPNVKYSELLKRTQKGARINNRGLWSLIY